MCWDLPRYKLRLHESTFCKCHMFCESFVVWNGFVREEHHTLMRPRPSPCAVPVSIATGLARLSVRPHKLEEGLVRYRQSERAMDGCVNNL